MKLSYRPNLHKKEASCPIGCRYCAVTKIDSRRELWEKKSILGLNKSVTIINPPFDRRDQAAMDEFYRFPPALLYADIIGFNATTDPFWPKYRNELEYFLEKFAPMAKLIVGVTKFNPPDDVLKKLSTIKNFRLNVSITGLNMLEKTKTADRLNLLARCRQLGVKALPVIHPYIAGMSDLSFLGELKKIGYNQVDVKGLRYNHDNMADWMAPNTRQYYEGTDEQEILIEDGWRQKLTDSGIELISIKNWYRQDGELYPKLERAAAEKLVGEVVRRANITSSDSDEAVIESAIQRRL